jgi:O-antigen/teichoic acid export membrane protein
MKTTTPLRQRLAAESILVLGIKVFSLPLVYLTTLLMARFWGAPGLGVYSLAVYLATTLSAICRLGLDTGMLRFGAGLQASPRSGGISGLFGRGLALVLGLSLAAAAGLFLARGWLAAVFHAKNLSEIMPLMALALPVTVAAAFCGETVRSLGGARSVVFQQDLLTPLSLLGMVAFLVWQGQSSSPAPLALAYLASSLVGLGFLTARLAGSFKGRREQGPGATFGDLVRYSWPLYLSVLLMLAFGALDSLVLGFFTGPSEVAYYEAAGRTALLVSLPLMALNAIVPPLFARLHQEGRLPELEEMAQAGTRWMYYGSLPLALFMAVLAPDILGLFGPGFGEAHWALQILLVAHLVNVACGSVGFLLAMTGQQFTLTAILALAGALGLPLMALGAAYFGLNGLALVKGLWLVAVNILMSLAVWRRLGLKLFAAGVGWAHISGAAGLGLFWVTRPCLGPWAAAGAGALLYLALITKTLYQEFTGSHLRIRWEVSR